MTEDKLQEVRDAKVALETARERFDLAIRDAMTDRIVGGPITGKSVADAAGWSVSRLYQFLASGEPPKIRRQA